MSGNFFANVGNVTGFLYLFEKCDQSTRECESEENYKKFMKDFNIQPSVYQYRMGFNTFNSDPVFRDFTQFDWVYPTTAYNGFYGLVSFLKKNIYETKDDILQFG